MYRVGAGVGPPTDVSTQGAAELAFSRFVLKIGNDLLRIGDYGIIMSNKITNRLGTQNLGPCMLALTERQREYVRMMVVYGDSLDAARAAGYEGEHPQSVRNTAWKFAHDPKIKAALREYAEAHLSAVVPLAAQAMENILTNPAHKDHFKAVERVLNQAGMVVATKHEVEVTDNRTTDELKSYIETIANAHGLDIKKIIPGYSAPALPAPNIIDVIATDVSDKEDLIEERVREEWEHE